MTGAGCATAKTATFDLRFLQTGTGTVQRTAISTAVSTAVIFSLVDRSMESSECDPTLSAAPYTRPLVLKL
jgi:hypothetical protein